MAPRRSGRRRTKPSSRWAIPTSVASALTSGGAQRELARDQPVLGRLDLGAGGAQMACEEPARVETVLGEEDAPAECPTLVGGGLPPLGRGGEVGRAVEQADARERARVDGQGERAALAGDAPHLQVAAQHAGEPLRDREPEARAPEAPRGRGDRKSTRLN